MAQGLPGSQFPGEDALIRRVKDLERQMQQLAAANQLATAGISAVPDGIVVQGSQTVNGPLEVNGAMEVNGNSVFNGAMSIAGALNLPAGIIGNDALTSPVTPLAAHADTTNFSITTGANVEKLRATITVPAGFTKAFVYATATMSVFNNSAGGLDSAYLSVRVNGAQVGWSNQVGAPASQRVLAVSAGAGLVSGLSGGTIYIGAEASTGVNAWAADNNNTLNIDAMVLFLR